MSRVKLTAGRIEAFRCEDGKSQSFLWHATVHQLALRATSTGAKAFIFQSTLAGKTIRMTIGSPKAWTIEQAESEARRLQTIVDSGKDPRQVKQDEIEAMKAAAAEKAAAEDAYSAETGHPFRRKLDTHSSANWTPVPGQTGHSGHDGTGSRFGFYS